MMLDDKKAIVSEVATVAKKALSVVAADYRGLTVSEMTELRRRARQVGVHLQVVRNTLSRRAFEGTDFECMKDALSGPLFLAFAMDAPGAAARLIRDYAKDHEKLEVKAISISGKLMDASALEMLASLPTLEEALTKLVFVMKAPIEKFVRTLAAPTAKLVRTIAAVRDQKQTAA
jgi:large subunit ribosomal protein L10